MEISEDFISNRGTQNEKSRIRKYEEEVFM